MTVNDSIESNGNHPDGISNELSAVEAPRAHQDYNGMPLSKWKDALRQDVEKRFGQPPEGLAAIGEPGW